VPASGDEQATGGGEPGAPSDDEFASLAPAPRPRSPLVALAVIALAGVLGWHLRDDLVYALRPRAAVDLGDARKLAAPFVDNTYVTVRGQPDRRNALAIEPKGGRDRQLFFRLLGTGTRLLVRALPPERRVDLDEQWSGRLRRVDALSYAPSLREYYANEVRAARYLALDGFRAALQSGHFDELRDRTGEPLTLAPSSTLGIDVLFADRLQVTLPKEKFPSEADARHELERLGLTPSPLDGTDEVFRYFVDAPAAKRNEVVAKLESSGIGFAVDASHLENRLEELSLVGDTLRRGTKDVVPWAAVQAVSVDAPIRIADDAWVVAEGESPESFLWAPALLVMLAAFAVFNVWYLARARRA
jgi:hypothetical protein